MKNNLKILLMTPWMEMFLGSETHFYALARAFQEMGFKVHIFTYLKDKMWDKMRETGARLLDDEIKDEYDLVIMNGNPCLSRAPRSAYKIFISNGVLPPPEQPILGADKYVSISEEVQDSLRQKGYGSFLIRNGIDCERFKPTRQINKKLKNVLLLSNKQNPRTKEFIAIEEACKELKVNLICCGLQFGTSVFETEEFINISDLVISLGRGVYEAMATGRNVICADYQGMDGFIDEQTYLEARKNNCSGRRFKMSITKETIIKELKKYNPSQGKKNRELILKDQNIYDTALDYLDIFNNQRLNV